ncbi:hypothetical protein PSN45_000509 [Yamadazyma tenuis]|uniref:DNA mismatch repair protein HSM3 n=1 Tax=Candida tenuis (strain ATCC 10573 / BCRC 21748 / CBS 615 / JCM 9827 / NBRC 10315 / NRRL Y-1498 / VKM Y-70) TaxID=590646 RepID=G3B965_CANTC|nr:uncharacterized protein CANTEDRAFT_94704 [Yamadazyma tenuis ATCC 10573]EGV61824.1 hypothetical protein CANTEDRAFT_94704 [Yamadazyma tenuis ATCC 10573]WEJ93049.1 hypothetical protein PSN45_000509 [Yamadazyma tenuis]
MSTELSTTQQHAIDAVRARNDTLVSLSELGTQLRNPDFRNSPQVLELIPTLADIFVDDCHSEPLTLEALRVLINLTADSDRNRCQIITHAHLWRRVLGMVGTERVSILLAQFVRNTECISKFSQFFYKLGIHEPLVKSLFTGGEVDVASVEFLAGVLVPEVLTPEFVPVAERYLPVFVDLYRPHDDLDHEDTAELYESLSTLLYHLTQFDDMDTTVLPQLYPLFEQYTESSSVSRQLFSTVGNLSSMHRFGTIADVHTALQWLPRGNLYRQAAAYLVVGNYVQSQAQCDEVNALVGDTFIRDYFSTAFSDVVQYQSLHAIKNLVTSATSKQVLDHPSFMGFSKVLIDNQSYYQEIFLTYLACVKKLVRLTFNDVSTSIYEYERLWSLVDSDEIYLCICPFMDRSECDLNQRLLTKVFCAEMPVEATRVLDRLKAQAVVLKNNVEMVTRRLGADSNFKNEVLVRLQKLGEMVSGSDESHPQHQVVANNARYVAGAMMAVGDAEVVAAARQMLV